MVGIIGIIASLTAPGLSLVITRLATVSLSLTGLSWETEKFQARSAFAGTGFTASEAEAVMNHRVRRKIIMGLMISAAQVWEYVVKATAMLVHQLLKLKYMPRAL